MTDQEILTLYQAAASEVSIKTASNREYVIALTRKILELAAPVAAEPVERKPNCDHDMVLDRGMTIPYCKYCGHAEE